MAKARGMTQALRLAMTTAARLRVRGKTWDEVAQTVGRNVNTLKHHAHILNRDEWRQIYQDAYDDYWAELEGRAKDKLIELLDAETEQVQQAAAATLVANSIKARPQKIEHSGDHVVIVCRLPEVGEAGEVDGEEGDGQDD